MNKNSLVTGERQFDALLERVGPVTRKVPAGGALFRQGDSTIGIFWLVRGRIRLLRVTAVGSVVPMHTVQAGELFAEASLFSPVYHCDAMALADSEVLLYRKQALTAALRQDPEVLWLFAGELAHRVQGLRTGLALRQIRSAPLRVLQALQLRCDASGCWRMDGTLKRFAEEIGLTHEALYRAMARLEGEGHIVRDGGRFIWWQNGGNRGGHEARVADHGVLYSGIRNITFFNCDTDRQAEWS